MSKIIFCLFFLGTVSSSVFSQVDPKEFPKLEPKDAIVTDLYVPKGFDNNDEVEVVVEGYLPNLCYHAPSVTSKIVDTKIEGKVVREVKLEVKTLFFQPDTGCPEMIVPFELTAKVGKLKAKKYDVLVNKGRPGYPFSLIDVDTATSGATDENIYAKVEYIDRQPGNSFVHLAGYNPSDCYTIQRDEDGKEMFNPEINKDKNAISVLPILVKAKGLCLNVPEYFRYKFEVPKVENQEKVLLHVRGMDGNAINKVFYYPEVD